MFSCKTLKFIYYAVLKPNFNECWSISNSLKKAKLQLFKFFSIFTQLNKKYGCFKEKIPISLSLKIRIIKMASNYKSKYKYINVFTMEAQIINIFI